MVKTSNTVRGNKFEVTKDVIKNRQSEKNKQCNSQTKRQIDKRMSTTHSTENI